MMNSNRQCGAIGTPSPATKAQMKLLTTWPVFDPLVAEEIAFANARSHAGTLLRKARYDATRSQQNWREFSAQSKPNAGTAQ